MWTLEAAFLGAIFVIGNVQLGIADPNFCGMKDPDPEKTCVSVRLPWQEEPVYFCTEKDKFHYRNQCGNHPMHCSSHWSKETLLVATPWDCCPLASVPDPCVNAQCPPKPFNRTCETLPVNSDNAWECCPKYYCDESGGMKKDCHFKQLQPGCTSPPKDKMNCVGFYDVHGCCTQYQCEGEGKPGMCPMQLQATKFGGKASQLQLESITATGGADQMMETATNPMMMMDMTTESHMRKRRSPMRQMMHAHQAGPGMTKDIKHMHMADPGKQHVESYGEQHQQHGNMMVGHEKHSYSITVDHLPAVQPRIACVGDFNCPGVMKCCSNDMSVYSDGMALPRNSHPTHGYCVDPIMM